MHTSPAPVFVLLASFVAASAQMAAPAGSQGPGATATTGSTAQSTAGMSTFHSDTLRLSYSYPATYTDATSMVGPAFEATLGQDAAAAPVAKCISVPLSRMAPTSGQFSLIVLLRADAACFKRKFNAKSVTELAQGEAQGLSASGARPNFGQVENFTVASRPAAMLRGSFTLPTGQAVQSAVVCVLDQPDIVCWQYLANTQANLNTLGTFPVTFDGSSATPLVAGRVE